MCADSRRSVAIAITGASGAIYATRTLAALLSRGIDVEAVISDYGRRVLRDELGEGAAVERILPAMPAFYQLPKTFDDLADFMAGKILSALGFEHQLYPEWTGQVER